MNLNELLDPRRPPYVIAELGVNHDGDAARALSLVEEAVKAGADAVKLQLFQAARLLSSGAMPAHYQRRAGSDDPFRMLQRLELSSDSMSKIVERVHELHCHAIVTVFSPEHSDSAEGLGFDALKTASPDIINRPLIESLIRTNRPLLLSTGTASAEEVRSAVRWLGDHPHALLHCVSSYPTPDECANLGGLRALQAITPRAIGYSDHTESLDTGAFAVASGAKLLEKHLTWSRAAEGPDHRTSLEPAQFRTYCELARRAWRMLGDGALRAGDIEDDVRRVARQSLTTVRALPAGHRLGRSDLTVKRPGTGLSPAMLEEVIGRTLRVPVKSDQPLAPEHLA
jgi:sialic acid synthase SpsE